MATPRLKKKFKWPGEAGTGRHTISWETHRGHMPFDPLASPYSNNAQFDTAVEDQAQSQYAPIIGDWRTRQREAESAHTGRASDITGLYNQGDAARKSALDRTSTALNSLITLNSGLTGGTRDAMAAALRSAQGSADATAKELGVGSQPVSPGLLDSVTASTDLSGIGTTGGFASILGGLGRDVGTNQVERQEASRGEGSRWDAVMKGLTGERSDIESQLPGFREKAREDLLNTELTRQGQRTQQGLAQAQQTLAESQFGEQKIQDKSQRDLATRAQTEAETQGSHDRTIADTQADETERSNRANESINQNQIDLQRQQILSDIAKAGDETTKTQLEAKAKRFDNGVKIIADYFVPTKQETAKSGKLHTTYATRVTNGYDAMVSQLMSATGAGEIEVRQMILAAVSPQTAWGKRWVARANKEITAIKAKRLRVKSNPGSGKNPPSRTGAGDVQLPKNK